MAAKKVYDLCVKIGDKNWLNIGAVLEKEDGGKFIILERTFSPAGVPNPDNKSSLIVSMFDPKPKNQESEPAPATGEEDIPF